MRIKILKPGLLSTIQDIGRSGFLSQGVPFSGAMDNLSARMANLAVGNTEDSAVIEFTQSAASFATMQNCLLAFSGGGADAFAGDQPLPLGKPMFVPRGYEIILKHSPIGSRMYMAIAGGWNIPEVLGSRSTYLPAKLGGIDGRPLTENDELEAIPKKTETTLKIVQMLEGGDICFPSWQIDANSFLPPDRNIIRVTPGRERDRFDANAITVLLNEKFKIGNNSNRMGLALQGPKMQRASKNEMLSTAVAPGTIQVTNNGELIILMADAQTTGGYPRIAQVAAVDLPLCAQLQPGDSISFVEIGNKQADALWFEQRTNLARLAVAIKLKLS